MRRVSPIFICKPREVYIISNFKKEKGQTTEINEDIRDKEIRLIGDDGSQLGIMSSRDAQALANEKKLDLVKIAPQANPPVCKIMDYGKYRYEQQKRDKEAKKKQKVTNVKEVRLSLNIEDHDLNTKAKNAMKFLKDGDKVKVSLRLKGREMGHPELAKEVIERFGQVIDEFGVMDSVPKLEGRSMTVIFSPRS